MSLNKQIFSTLFPYLPAQKGSANPFEYRTAAFNPAEPFPYPAERNEPLVNRTPSWNPNPSDDDELLRQRQIAELGHEIQTLGGTANVPLGNIQSEDPLWSTVARPPVMDGGGLVYNSSPPDEPTPSFEQYQNEQREQVALGQPRIQGSVLPSPDDLKKKKIKLPPPVFVPNPNSTPAQNKYDEAVFKVNNPVNQDKGWKGRIKEIVGNFLYGMGQTPQGVGIGGALLMGGIGATAGTFNRSWNEQRQAKAALPGAYQNLKIQTDIGDVATNNQQRQQQLDDTKTYRSGQIKQNELEEKGRNQRARLGALASQVRAMPVIDPKHPNFAAIEKALSEFGVPLLPKDAKKEIKTHQDAESGAWFVSFTDPVTKEQEVRLMLGPDGKQLITTSSSKVMANAAGERQMSQHGHDVKMVGIRAEYVKKGDEYKAKLAEIKAEKDQTRKLQLQAEASTIQQDAIRLRAQLDE